jgi:hypothetical protein
VYKDTEQLHAVARDLFQRIEAENPQAARTLLGSRLVIRLRTSDPAGEIWINGRRAPLQTSFGPASLRPDLDIQVPADILHLILAGQLPLKKALGNGHLQVRGPVWRATVLADLFHQGQHIYPVVLRDQGVDGAGRGTST